MKKKVLQELYEHYKELYTTACSEYRFGLLCVDHLKTTLEEVLTISDSELIKGVIENALNRHELDKIIHAKMLFKDDLKL